MSEKPTLDILCMSVGPVAANAYLLMVGSDAVVVDPGAEGDRIAAELRARQKTLRAVWLTHAHFDHVAGIAALLADAPRAGNEQVPVHMHPADQPLLQNAAQAALRWSIRIDEPPSDTTDISHGQLLSLAHVQAKALHTPGHAPGHIAFYLPEHDLLLSGDALFKGSVGRTDLPYSDEGQLLDSIRRELLALPDATQVLPGHGPTTTIGAERYGNPFL